MDYQTEAGDRAGAQSGAGAESGGDRTMWGVPLQEHPGRRGALRRVRRAPLAGYDTPGVAGRLPLVAEGGPVRLTTRPWRWRAGRRAGLRGDRAVGVALRDLLPAARPGAGAHGPGGRTRTWWRPSLDRVEAIQTEMMQRFFARAPEHLDLVFISDDIGGPEVAAACRRGCGQRHLQPRLKRWCDLVHAHGLRVFYHTDGAARPLLKPILDCGVDVLNPIQHACPGMDLRGAEAGVRPRVIFHGGVDNQIVLPRGTAEEVRAEVRECLRTLGAGARASSAARATTSRPARRWRTSSRWWRPSGSPPRVPDFHNFPRPSPV